MLTMLTNLLKNLRENNTKLFADDSQHEMLKISLAVIMAHIILADGRVTKQEEKKVIDFFANEFDLDHEETNTLFQSIINRFSEFQEQMETLIRIIQNDIKTKALLLEHLNNLIICDGCTDSEYRVFETIRTAML